MKKLQKTGFGNCLFCVAITNTEIEKYLAEELTNNAYIIRLSNEKLCLFCLCTNKSLCIKNRHAPLRGQKQVVV